jgi:hypothetical protein
MDKHPILIPNGFQIYTKPVEAVVNCTLTHVENDHHGAAFFGGSGLGKEASVSGSWMRNIAFARVILIDSLSLRW